MKNLQIAIIEWTDSTYYKHDFVAGELEIEYPAPSILYSTGFLLQETENFVVICQDLESNMKASRMVTIIPRVSIISIVISDVEIEGSKKKTKRKQKNKT